MRVLASLMLAAVVLAGCSGGGGGTVNAARGDFTLAIADNLDSGRVALRGVYLGTADGWKEALGDGTSFEFKGSGANVSQQGAVVAGSYDRLRLVFGEVSVKGRAASLTQDGIEVLANVTVPASGDASVALVFSWVDSVFESKEGLAFSPVLTRLVVSEGGAETQRLEANQISSGSAKPPVARMRIFDATGLEAFVSTFVADSPEDPVIGNAGNITFSGSPSTAVTGGATIASYQWDISGLALSGNTVTWASPVNGGNFTVRLTVKDSEGVEDTQSVKLALKPASATRTFTFTGEVSGAGGTEGVAEHTWDVNATGLDGAPANLTHVLLQLTPGEATVPYSDLDVTLDDGAAKRIGAQTGTGSQHKIDVDVANPGSGTWKVRVVPDPAVGAQYTVKVTLTWVGYNPGMSAFLASYDDGHTHQH